MPFNGPTLPNLPVSLGTGSSQEPSVIVLKLDPSGSNVIFCAYLSGGTSAKGVALDGEGNVYVAGTAIANYQTNLVDFPVTAGAFQRTPKCKQDSCGTAFVAKLNPSGTALVHDIS